MKDNIKKESIEQEAKAISNLIDEHKFVYNRLIQLDDQVYNQDTSNIEKIDFANLCVMLSAIRQYEKCLLALLMNEGIIFENGVYFSKVGEIKDNILKDADFEDK